MDARADWRKRVQAGIDAYMEAIERGVAPHELPGIARRAGWAEFLRQSDLEGPNDGYQIHIPRHYDIREAGLPMGSQGVRQAGSPDQTQA